MRSWIAFLAFSLLFATAAVSSCSSSDTSNGDGSPTAVTVTGAGGSLSSGCNGAPDQFCNNRGGLPETCACPDCAETAFCRNACNDDGTCSKDADAGEVEDCTCADCYGRVAGCPPRSVGCKNDDNGACSDYEDCTCPDCTGTPRCTDNCDSNGSCVEYLEGCSCEDCRSVERCGGSGPTTTATTAETTTTTSASGMGGASGVGGAGGAGGM